MKPTLTITAIGDAAIQNATVVAGNSTVHFQGYSTTYTVTSGTKYVTNVYFYTFDDDYSIPGTITTIEGAGYYPQAQFNFLAGISLIF